MTLRTATTADTGLCVVYQLNMTCKSWCNNQPMSSDLSLKNKGNYCFTLNYKARGDYFYRDMFAPFYFHPVSTSEISIHLLGIQKM